MRKLLLPVLAFASVFVWVACDTQQPTQPGDLGPSFLISDGAQNDGNENFFWLPPLVSPPTTTGAFIGTLSPMVKICKLSDCGGQYWEFERTSGPAGHRVGVDVKGQHYHLNWDTKDPAFDALEPDVSYRISVWLGGMELGYADVQFGISQNEVRYLQDNTIIPLSDGRTLPIKFRIEYGVLDDFDFDMVYHSNRDVNLDGCVFNHDVYLFNSVTGVSVNITSSPATMDGTPSWSPDGMKIVFASNGSDDCSSPDIFVMDLEAGTVTQLTTDGGWQPAWSPDGMQIAFQKGWPPEPPPGTPEDSPLGRQHDIWVMDADGGNPFQLTDVGHPENEDPYEDWGPTWNRFGPQQPSVTFARSENYPFGACPPYDPEEPWTWNLDPGSLDTCYFDIVSKGVGTPVQRNHTRNRFVDQLGPAWHPLGQGFVYSVRDGDSPIPGPDLGSLWARLPGVGDVELVPGEGMVTGDADWYPIPPYDKILFARGSSYQSMGLWEIKLDGTGLTEIEPSASYGRYRPPTTN